MKQIKELAIPFFILIIIPMLIGCCGPKDVVIFPDENLEAFIRDSLGKSAGGEKINVAELAILTELWAANKGITDLTGLEYCTNLTELYLQHNQISDISPIFSLTNLTLLRISSNQISDISALVKNSGLGEGDKVYLHNNKLEITESSDDMQDIVALEHRGVEVIY